MKHKRSTTLTYTLVIAILGFMALGQLKIISATVSVSTAGLCIVSLIMIVIKDIVMSNKEQNEASTKEKNESSTQ